MPNINLFCSSNTEYGATNKSSIGSTFSVNFPTPIRIPLEAKNIEVWLHSFGCWYSFPNISTTKSNNTIYLTDSTSNYEKYPIVIPNGLYSVDLLNAAISYQLNASGFATDLISFTGDLATGKTILNTTASGYAVYFKTNQSPYTLLGFNAEQKVPPTGTSTGTTSKYTSPNVATFSDLESLTLQSSLVNSTFNNGKTSSVLASIPIGVAAGQNIIYEPSNLIKCDSSHLRGSTISQITFILGDQNLVPLDTNQEDFTCRVVIHYD